MIIQKSAVSANNKTFAVEYGHYGREWARKFMPSNDTMNVYPTVNILIQGIYKWSNEQTIKRLEGKSQAI